MQESNLLDLGKFKIDLASIVFSEKEKARDASYMNSIDAESEKKLFEMRAMKRIYGIGIFMHDCIRKQWYDVHQREKPTFSEATLKIFAQGHLWEKVIVESLRQMEGVKVFGEQDIVMFHPARGVGSFIDCLIEYKGKTYCVEVKSTNKHSLANFKKLGMYKKNKHYFNQLNSYCTTLGLEGLYIVVSRDTPNEIYLEYLKPSQDKMNFFLKNLDDLFEWMMPPPPISTNKDYFLCSGCQYKDKCHSEQYMWRTSDEPNKTPNKN